MSAEAANRLINEKSPYLLQHAHNPVNWYPWGDEAFEKARQEDKPVFVSIGYSTCHWCHVMAHESFEDAEVAAILNAQFVSVKVDREERPDVDAVYMAACQALTGGGGWPLTVLLDADRRPFFAGTYFPKHARFGHMGLVDLLINISRQWQSDRQRLTEAGAQIVEYLENTAQSHREGEPNLKLIADGVQLFKRMFDRQNGGFGSPPKFPSPHNLLFLLRYAKLEKDETALAMATHTLTQMARGGLFDQIGGGFSRYSTDAKWLIPHFEKMLYDNALLALAYTEGYVQTGSPYFQEIATRTLDYVLRELCDATGGFHCGQDADSDGVEGKFYAITPEEVNGVLAEDAREFCRTYDITKLGNFEGQSIPNLLAFESFEHAYARHSASLEALYGYRIERTMLHKDDKILTSWNALMIHALSVAAAVFRDQRYFKAALGCVNCIQAHLTADNGRLYVRYRDGEARHMGQLDDYAFYALALLSVYSVNFDERTLARAVELGDMMLSLFFDENRGGFYLTASDSEQLIMRPKEVHDGAIPSGNGVAALVLVKLFRLTGDMKWQRALDQQMRFLCGTIKAYPVGHSVSLLALTQMLYPASELICVSADEGVTPSLPEALQNSAYANLSVIVKTPGNADALSAIAPWTKDYPVPEDGTMYYLCENGACNAPTNDVDSLLEMLSASMK